MLRSPSHEGRFPFPSHCSPSGLCGFENRRTRGQVKWGLNEECENVIQSHAFPALEEMTTRFSKRFACTW